MAIKMSIKRLFYLWLRIAQFNNVVRLGPKQAFLVFIVHPNQYPSNGLPIWHGLPDIRPIEVNNG